MWDFSSPTRDQTHAPSIGSSLNHWTTREVTIPWSFDGWLWPWPSPFGYLFLSMTFNTALLQRRSPGVKDFSINEWVAWYDFPFLLNRVIYAKPSLWCTPALLYLRAQKRAPRIHKGTQMSVCPGAGAGRSLKETSLSKQLLWKESQPLPQAHSWHFPHRIVWTPAKTTSTWGFQWFLAAQIHNVLCLVTQLCLTFCDSKDWSPPGSSVHGDSSGKYTGVGCHLLLQGIVPTQGWLNPGLPHCRPILYHLRHQGSPQCTSSQKINWNLLVVENMPPQYRKSALDSQQACSPPNHHWTKGWTWRTSVG